jgi:hypothetical protein
MTTVKQLSLASVLGPGKGQGTIADTLPPVKAFSKGRGRPKVTPKAMTIGQNWRIGSDSLNVILYRRSVTKFGKVTWREHGYFGTVANALIELVNQGVRDTELVDLQTVVKKQDELYQMIALANATTTLGAREGAAE